MLLMLLLLDVADVVAVVPRVVRQRRSAHHVPLAAYTNENNQQDTRISGGVAR